jgi:hypothetical protein
MATRRTKGTSQSNALTDAALVLDAIASGRVEPADEAAAPLLWTS